MRVKPPSRFVITGCALSIFGVVLDSNSWDLIAGIRIVLIGDDCRYPAISVVGTDNRVNHSHEICAVELIELSIWSS